MHQYDNKSRFFLNSLTKHSFFKPEIWEIVSGLTPCNTAEKKHVHNTSWKVTISENITISGFLFLGLGEAWGGGGWGMREGFKKSLIFLKLLEQEKPVNSNSTTKCWRSLEIVFGKVVRLNIWKRFSFAPDYDYESRFLHSWQATFFSKFFCTRMPRHVQIITQLTRFRSWVNSLTKTSPPPSSPPPKYSPDLALWVFHLFGLLKESLRGHHFEEFETLKNVVGHWLRNNNHML